MDNNFYEYNRETRQRNTQNREKEKGIMTRIIIVQLVLSLCVTGILFAVCRKESSLSQNIKTFYNTICEKDMSVAEILGVFKRLHKQHSHHLSKKKQQEKQIMKQREKRRTFLPFV